MNLLDLFVRIGVKDEASGAIDDVSQSMIGELAGAAAKAGKALAGAFAVKKVIDFGKAAFDAYGEFEQLAGGAEKIFDEMDQSKILADANGAWKNLNMSANEYLAAINQTGAMFAQTMGDEKGYETAKQGMQAISDYASGTGRDINELNEKFGMITRSTSSYQSIADQFSGILPATSKDFLEQAQAADLLSDSYTSLTDVPVAEYQQAVSGMLEKGVADLGLAGNTAKESLGTITGSIAATKSAWQNLVTEFGKPDADIGARISDMATAIMGEGGEGGLLRNVVNEVATIGSNVANAVGMAVSQGLEWIVSNGPTLVSNAMQSIGSALGNAAANLMSFNDIGFDSWFTNLLGSGKDMADTVANFVKGIGDSIANNWQTIQANISALWDEAVSFVQTHGPQILSAIGNVLGSIGNAILEHGPELLGAAAEALGSLMEWVTSNGPTLVNTAVSVIGNLIDTARNWLVENGPSILEAAKTAFGNIVTAIAEHGPEILSNIGNTIGLVIGYIIDAAPKMLAAAAEFMGGLITGTSKEGETLHKWFADFFPDGLLKGLGNIGKMLLDTGKSLINGLLDGIGEVAPEVEESIRGAFDKVLEFFGAIGDFITDPVGSIKAGFDILIGSSEDAEKGTADSMAKVQGNIEGAMGASVGAIGAYNDTALEDKSATASVRGNAMDGKAKSQVDATNRSISSGKSKTVTAKATGNATDGKAKSAIDNTRGAVDNLKGKGISVSASGNVITGAAQSMVSGMRDWLSGLRDKTFTVTQKTVKKGGAWGGITPTYHATGGVRIADRYGEGVPLDVVGERGPEAIVPLTSHYGRDFAQMMGEEASKHMGRGDINIYLEYNAGEDAKTIVSDMTSELELLGLAGGGRWR